MLHLRINHRERSLAHHQLTAPFRIHCVIDHHLTGEVRCRQWRSLASLHNRFGNGERISVGTGPTTVARYENGIARFGDIENGTQAEQCGARIGIADLWAEQSRRDLGIGEAKSFGNRLWKFRVRLMEDGIGKVGSSAVELT